MTSPQLNRIRHRGLRRALAQLTQQGSMPPQGLITAAARKALEASDERWDPDLDLTVRFVGQGPPISIRHTCFKTIDVSINMGGLLERCTLLGRSSDTTETAIAGQITYSMVRLWIGHYDHCPYDSWRHQFLCRAAAKGTFGTTAISSRQRALVEAVTALFERSIVACTISKAEGDYFAKGIVYEHFVNEHRPNLLTNLFFLGQTLVAPKAWQTVLSEFPMPNDPLARALLPEVLKLVFGLRVAIEGRSIKVIPDRPYCYLGWPDRVARLAALLIPYINETAQRSGPPSSPFGWQNELDGDSDAQSQGAASALNQMLEQMDNPFVSADSEPNNPQSTMQPGGLSAGRSSPPFPRYNLEQLDIYYTQRASEVVVEAEASDMKEPKKPDLLEVGSLDSEPTSLRALASGQIDLFRMRVVRRSGWNELKLFKRSEPLEVPLGGDEPASEKGPPHLLLLVDSSSSMGFNPRASSDRRAKYDLVLRSCYGIFKHIEMNNFGDSIQVACINFSGMSLESGWHPYRNMENVKRTLLTYQGGGTTLSPDAIRRAFQARPGSFLAIAITDGGLSNTAEAVSELKKVVESDCDLVLLHVGQPNAFTKAVEEMNCPVYILSSANDLVGLSLQIAKEGFKSSKI